MTLTEVSNILWRERQLLELLLFKLEEEQLLLAAGRSRWLAHATREVETVLAEIKRVEETRAAQVQALAVSMGLAPTASLRELAEAAPPPWDSVFVDHREAFLAATQEISSLAQDNRELLSRGYHAARQVLSSMDDQRVETYSPAGLTTNRSPARLVDEAL
ncbi:MAG TPA: flagellar export chaperone FlgN [Egibacteraceae bacterium]|nr:flagellar export chaperone FlgN [Egibacteraceae bacterium]